VTEHGLTPITRIDSASRAQSTRRQGSAPALPSEPPAALQAEYSAAARVIEDLAARQVNLHFEIDHNTNRVHVQMLDWNGDVIREIPTKSLLDALSGGGLLIDQKG
jgi:uncharacterized FlaG/YvyC family protein